MISTVIEGAAILDGTGGPRFTTDVAIAGTRIARVGSCADLESGRRVDARGLLLVPGFIDACSQTNDGWLSLPSWTSSLGQGITAEITGVCGVSAFDPELREAEPAVTRRSFATGNSVREACEAGAIGASIDLRAAPASEALRIAREARDGGAPRIAVHLRDYGRDLGAALGEALGLAERAGVGLHLSHLQARHPAPPGTMDRALERIDRERTRGAQITCDVYPYIATWIELASLLAPAITPEALNDDGVAAAAAIELGARLGNDGHDVMLAEVSSEERLAWCGMRFDEIASGMRLSPARAIVEFVRHEGERARAFYFTLREDDVATALSASFCCIGTDAAACAPSDARFGLVHPRTFGTTARVIGRFVRHRRALSIEEAVRRMTSLPARTFGLDGHGEIREDARADLLLLNEATFSDTATYERPVSPPVGLKDVWVAGSRKGV